MSVYYPVPTPLAAKRIAHAPAPFVGKTMFLPAAPVVTQLPSLVMAPPMPPQGRRL